MPANIYDLVPVLMCGMSWILCTLVSPNSWDHSDGLASMRKLHVVTCNFFHALFFFLWQMEEEISMIFKKINVETIEDNG